jgi:hypothetical protein
MRLFLRPSSHIPSFLPQMSLMRPTKPALHRLYSILAQARLLAKAAPPIKGPARPPRVPPGPPGNPPGAPEGPSVRMRVRRFMRENAAL